MADTSKHPEKQAEQPPRNAFADGYAMATHFIMTTLVGAALGWGLDSLIGTVPLFLLLGLFLGLASGLYKLIQYASKKESR